MSSNVTRRTFVQTGVAAATMLTAPRWLEAKPGAQPAAADAGDRLRVAHVGCGGRGGSHLGVGTPVALCEVNTKTLATVAKRFPQAKTYTDYRVMFEKQKDFDAVVVATPDHSHFHPAYMAMQLGKPVYVEKPMTHSIWEARTLTELAAKKKVATQMGNQGHSGDGYRVLCEFIWAGAIGDVTEVHCQTNRPIWPQGVPTPTGDTPVPPDLEWDLWLGPAPARPYNPIYAPFKWRGWGDFGCGALGDMGCHIMDGACWALQLGQPDGVEVVDASSPMKDAYPSWSIIRWDFPARKVGTPDGRTVDMPRCKLFWYDGGKQAPRPKEMEQGRRIDTGGTTYYVGTKGAMMTGCYGGGPRIVPETAHQAYMEKNGAPKQVIPRVKSHHADWVQACKGGTPSSANFSYAGPFTELVLLGVLALRLGKKLQWDSAKLCCPNAPEADAIIKRPYRKGWEV